MLDGVAPIFLVGFVCCLPMLAVGGPVAYVFYRNRQRLAGSEAVAEALGLEKVIQLKQMWWYEGRWEDGRLIGMMPIGIKRRGYSFLQERTTTSYDSAVRIVIELLVAEPLGVEVARHINWAGKRGFASFEEAFNAENGDRLSAAAQDALLDFVQVQPCTLWLSDRATVSDRVITDPQIMAEATSILLFEYETNNPEPADVREKTAALVALANILEANHPPMVQGTENQ